MPVLFLLGVDGNALYDLWIFDLETLLWSQPAIQGTPPEARSYHTASLIGDKLLIFGGKARKQWFNDVTMLDFPSRSWNPINLAGGSGGGIGRAYHTATVIQDQFVCVVGGYDGTTMCKDIALIDLSCMRWLSYSKTDMLRCKHTTNLMPSGNVLLSFGGHDGRSFLNTTARMDLEPIFQFVMSNAPPKVVLVPEDISIAKADDTRLIDKENAIVYNQAGTHVRPDLLAQQVETLLQSVAFFSSQQLPIMDDEILTKMQEALQLALQKTTNELDVREKKKARKRTKGTVRFGEVAVREHKRAVGHGNVTSDGGPALGIDTQYADRLMRRLSSYENLRAAVRVPRQEYMKTGYKAPEERYALLNESGASRTSMDLNMRESAQIKEDRKESSNCIAAVLMSEAGLLPSKGNTKLT